MNTEEMQKEIRGLLKEKNAVLLAHYYQEGDIQDIADFLGDSLALSMEAARTRADCIVFAGVRFMAETAAILAPDKTVLLPVPEAGCPLADRITADELKKARQQHPHAAVVTYVNSTAETKALSDICCTSTNAVKVVQSMDTHEILMTPDGNLARYVSRFTRIPIIPWNGDCPVHQGLTPGDIRKVREEHPGAPLAVHPECSPEVIDLADFTGSTSAIIEFAGKTEAGKVIIGTESGIIHELEKRYPGKTFVAAAASLVCEDMKKIKLKDVLAALRETRHVVTVAEEIRLPAHRALSRMLELA
ncbi:MAG: quinolinate synthase NadA [Syntrophales bacterium]|nr:quinolinate synthase NadA [Syntrophales bacterium]